MAALIVIGFTNTHCSKRTSGNDITPITGGDTQSTSTKKDTSGEDLNVTVYQNTTTSGSREITGGSFQVYLFNNFHDYNNFLLYDSLKSNLIDSNSHKTGDATCQFQKVKPASSAPNYTYFRSGPYKDKPITYYLAAYWYPSTGGKPWKGFYNTGPGNTSGSIINIAINNGLNVNGNPFPMSVSPQ